MNDPAQALFEAHVAHLRSRMQGEPLVRLLETLTTDLFEWFDTVEVEQLVQRDTIVAIIRRYAIELEVSAGITELAGEMAHVVLSLEANARTKAADLIAPEMFADFVDAILALEGVRDGVIRVLARSTALRELATKVAAHVVADPLQRGATRWSTGPVAGFAQQLQDTVVPELERRIHKVLAQQLDRHREAFAQQVEYHLLAAIDPESLRATVDEIWQTLSGSSLARAFTFVGEQDLGDFVVMIFEFWLRLRKTAYFDRIVVASVDQFFDKYGTENVSGLIEDMGVTPDIVTQELKTVVVPAAALALESGFLERQIRDHLRGFYESAECAELLSSNR